MKSRHRIFGYLAILLGLSTCGCLHRHVNNSKGFAASASPFLAYFTVNNFDYEWVGFWPMPVSPSLTDDIERMIERCEKDGVPILGPIKGEFAPVFCMDPPTELEIYETLPPIPHGVPFVWEVQRKNVRFNIEKIVDQVDPCRFFPLAGPCQLHHCHFKCTIWWDETTTMAYPIPWSYTDHKQEVVYIDKDHLHRCGEPGHLAPAGGPSTVSRY